MLVGPGLHALQSRNLHFGHLMTPDIEEQMLLEQFKQTSLEKSCNGLRVTTVVESIAAAAAATAEVLGDAAI